MEAQQMPPVPTKPPIVFGPAICSTRGGPHDVGKQELQYNWAHAHMRYLPNEARREAEEAIFSAQAEAAKHKAAALDALKAQAVAEHRATEAERQRRLELAAADDLRIAQTKDLEGRIQALERTLEVERAQQAEELRLRERQAHETQEQCKLLMDREQQRCSEVVRCVEAKVKEAQELAEQARKRADEGIALARSREEARVKEIRETTEDRMRKLEARHAEAIERMRAEIARERLALEEKNRQYMKQSQEALQEANRRIENSEKSMQIWTSTKEIQMAKKECDWRDWVSTVKQEKLDLEKHHTKLLNLEKEEHGRVMSRALDRVVRSLKLGLDSSKDEEVASTLSTAYLTTPSPDLHHGSQVPELPGLVFECDQR